MKIEVMAEIVEGRYYNELVAHILSHRVVIAHIPKDVEATPELIKGISEEWAKPEYSINSCVLLPTVKRLAATAHLDSQPK